MKKILLAFLLLSCQVFSQQNKNIKTFIEIYSQIRYFYPSDQFTTEEWDRILLSGIEMCQKSSNLNFTTNISSFFEEIAPLIKTTHKEQHRSQFFNKKDQVFWQYKGFQESQHGVYDQRLINSGSYIPNSGLSCWFDERLILNDATIKISCTAKSISNEKNNLLLQLEAFDYSTKKDSILKNEVPLSKDWRNIEIDFKMNQGKSFISILTNLIGDGSIAVKNLSVEIIINGKVHTKKINFEHRNIKQIEHSSLRSPFGYEYSLDSLQATLFISRNLYGNPEWFCNVSPKPNSWKSIKIDTKNYIHIPISISKNIFVKNKKKQASYKLSDTDYTFEVVKCASLLKTHSVFNLFFPYKNELNIDMHVLFDEYLVKVQNTTNEADLYSVIKEYVAKFNDGHSFVHNDLIYDSRCVDADFSYYSGKLYVRGASSNSFLNKGDRILSVNSVPVEKILENRIKYRSGSYQWKYNRETLIFGCGDSLELDNYTVVRNNDTLIGKLKKDSYAGYYLESKFDPVTDLKDSVYYIDLSRVSYTDFLTLFDTLKNAKGIIFDLREYPIISPELLSHLTNSNLVSVNWQTPIVMASIETIMDTSSRWEISPSPIQLEQKIVFLTGSGTMSYGESLLDIIKYFNLGTVIGERSAGINGNKTHFYAPGGYKIYFTGMNVTRMDGTSFFAKGIEPDILIEGIYDIEKDNVVDYAKNYLQSLINN